MEVLNRNMPLGEIIGPDGAHYQGDHRGIFKVPSDFGNWLCGTPNWTPKDGDSLGSVSTKLSPEAAVAAVVNRPEGMSEEAHARQLAREAAKPEPEVVRADTQEPQALGTAPPAPTLEPPTPPVPPAPPAPTLEPPASEVPAQAEGPNLEAMTKADLIETAAEYRAKGYAIPEVTQAMLKDEIKTTISTVLYGE